MNEYFNSINKQINEYFSVLTKEIPEFIYKYIDIVELKRLRGVGYFCGMDYCSKEIYDFPYFYSRFDHSLSTALMTWNFTKDKKQTIAALLHDISTPVFSHVIDYMKDDRLNQESTEERTEDIIRDSKELLYRLKTDEIDIDHVIDFKRYSIVDNDRPKLCCDRLDSIFINNILWTKKTSINDVKEIYESICVIENEEGELELGTSDINIANKIVELSINIGYATNMNEDKVPMQLLADIVKNCIDYGYIFEDMLYVYTEQDIINIIDSVNEKEVSQLWKTFLTMKEVISEEEILKFDRSNNYYISFDSKMKYVDPIINTEQGISRISKTNINTKKKIEEYKLFKDKKWAYVEKYKFYKDK